MNPSPPRRLKIDTQGEALVIEVFDYRDPEVHLIFDITAMCTALVQHLEMHGTVPSGVHALTVTLDPKHVAKLYADGTINPKILVALTDGDLAIPILGALFENGKTLIIDGNHRLARHHELGHTTYPMLRWTPEAWRPFIIDEDEAWLLGPTMQEDNA